MKHWILARQLAKALHIMLTIFLKHTYLNNDISFHHPHFNNRWIRTFQRAPELTIFNWSRWDLNETRLHYKFQCTNYPMRNGADTQTDGQAQHISIRLADLNWIYTLLHWFKSSYNMIRKYMNFMKLWSHFMIVLINLDMNEWNPIIEKAYHNGIRWRNSSRIFNNFRVRRFKYLE